MIARFDHRPKLTAALALATIVLVVVVVTLATLLITLQPAASPQSHSGGGNPAAQAQSGGGVGSGAGAYFGNDSLKEQHVPPVLAAQSGHFTQGQPKPAEPPHADDSVERYRQATQ
jgi:hypothetical protein